MTDVSEEITSTDLNQNTIALLQMTRISWKLFGLTVFQRPKSQPVSIFVRFCPSVPSFVLVVLLEYFFTASTDFFIFYSLGCLYLAKIHETVRLTICQITFLWPVPSSEMIQLTQDPENDHLFFFPRCSGLGLIQILFAHLSSGFEVSLPWQHDADYLG